MSHIVSQTCLPEGVWTVWSNGTAALVPYLIDKDGAQYVELFPNDTHE